jgi:hypothetical protein
MDISFGDVSNHLLLAADVVHTLLRWQSVCPDPIITSSFIPTIDNPIAKYGNTGSGANKTCHLHGDDVPVVVEDASCSSRPASGDSDGSAIMQNALLSLLAHVTSASRKVTLCSRQVEEGNALINSLVAAVGELRCLTADQKGEIDCLRASLLAATQTTTQALAPRTTSAALDPSPSSCSGNSSSKSDASLVHVSDWWTQPAVLIRDMYMHTDMQRTTCRDAAVNTEDASWRQLEETVHVGIYVYVCMYVCMYVCIRLYVWGLCVYVLYGMVYRCIYVCICAHLSADCT